MGHFYGIRVCKHPDCNIKFSPYRSWQEFHSPTCRNAYYEHFVRHPLAKVVTEMEEDKVKEKEKVKKFR